jgi:TetR/AcrR family transcriptional regulator, regulator of cefoperazone and chloramphenicol sensitivity
MPNRRTPVALSPLPGKRRSLRKGTRAELLEAAGHVFAEKGFDRATGQEICLRAGANVAAINYYFGGIDALYAAALEEANRRLVPVEALSAAIAGKNDARAKLQALIELVANKLMGPISSSWAFRVLSREITAPSPALEALVETQGLQKARIVRSIVAELMELPENHLAVARGCISVLAPLILLFLADRQALKRSFPNFCFDRDEAKALAHHTLQFALAGLSAVARDTRKETTRRRPADRSRGRIPAAPVFNTP